MKLFIFLSFCCLQCYADVNIDEANALATNEDTAAMLQTMPTYTIKPGSHTAEQNAEHQKYCAQFDAKDVTDNSDIQVGYGNVDPMDTTVFCMGEGIPKSGDFAGAGAIAVNSDSELSLPFVGAGVGTGAVNSSSKSIQQSKSLRITYSFYRYKLPLDKLNQLLTFNKIQIVRNDNKTPYIAEVRNDAITKISSSFSLGFEPANSGNGICVVDGSICQFGGSMTTNSGTYLVDNISFYPYDKNNQILIHLNTFDNFVLSKGKPLKLKTELDNVSGKSFVIMSYQQVDKLVVGQVILISFNLKRALGN